MCKVLRINAYPSGMEWNERSGGNKGRGAKGDDEITKSLDKDSTWTTNQNRQAGESV